ncbi:MULTISPECIES: amidohydrolase [unclassified Haladaptatus]|uniref:amidohydrolase n=1 Tax=unclassified Haladaptatus TaxID=2622732 RepID=UPI0023E85025|nr:MULTISPECIES: amidohydrolase [unclassified Haladaptatus]
MSQGIRDRAVEIRRTFHRYPEPSWREFLTTSRLVDELEALDVDELHVGSDVLVSESRMSVPEEADLDHWFEKARENGAREDVLEKTKGGHTGVVAVVEKGDGPVLGLRVDIDALPQPESTDESHYPVQEGFRSENENAMHACGHDSHMTMGLGTIEAIQQSDFSGTLKVFFQPAEEVLGGGKSMADSPLIEDVEGLLAVHIGLGHPSGEIVAGSVKPLSVQKSTVRFTGEPAHAGLAPNEGRNVMQAAAAAIQNLYAIPRHADGMTRVNVGKAKIGEASNIIPDHGELQIEVRAETNDLRDYMQEKAERTIRAAAEMHDVEVDIEMVSRAPRVDSDETSIDAVATAAKETDGVTSVLRTGNFGASEDATYLMRAVQENGGVAGFPIVGTDHPGGHHTATFDVNEDDIFVGIDVLSGALLELERRV